jgi:hypothetical protein
MPPWGATPKEESERATCERAAMMVAVGLTLELGRAVLRKKERDAAGEHGGPPFLGHASGDARARG